MPCRGCLPRSAAGAETRAVTPAPPSRCLQLQLGTNSWNRRRFKIQLCCCANILGNENKQRKERDMGLCATMLPRRRWAAREQRTRARPQRVARGRRLPGSGSFPGALTQPAGCTRPRGTHSRWCPGRKCCPAVVPWVLPGRGELQHLPNTLPLTAAPRPMCQGHPQPFRRLRGGTACVPVAGARSASFGTEHRSPGASTGSGHSPGIFCASRGLRAEPTLLGNQVLFQKPAEILPGFVLLFLCQS